MATYKQPCIHCGAMLERDARFCPACASASPFLYSCPSCLREIKKGQAVCSGCGRPLYIACPFCGEKTFVQDKCEACDKDLTLPCADKRCGVKQFFENTKCTACGKKLKNTIKKG